MSTTRGLRTPVSGLTEVSSRGSTNKIEVVAAAEVGGEMVGIAACHGG